MFPQIIRYKDALPIDLCELTQAIYGDNYGVDVSMVATLKALFHDRVPVGEHLEFRLMNLPKINWEEDADIGSYIATTIPRDQSLVLCHIDGSISDRDMEVELYAEAFEKMFPEYKSVKHADNFMDKTFLSRSFSNEDKKSGVIFIGRMDLRRFHYVQIITPVVLSWYGVHSSGITKEKLAILKSFISEDPCNEYLEALNAEYEIVRGKTKA